MKIVTSNLNAAKLGHKNALAAFNETTHVRGNYQGTSCVNNLQYVASTQSSGAVYTTINEYNKNVNKEFADLLIMLSRGQIDYVSIGARWSTSTGLMNSHYYDIANGDGSNVTDVMVLIRDPEVGQEKGFYDCFCLLWGSSEDRTIYNGRIDIVLNPRTVELGGSSIWMKLRDEANKTSSPIDIDLGEYFVNLDELGRVAVKGVGINSNGELVEYYINNVLTEPTQSDTLEAETKQPVKETKMSKSQSIVNTLIASNKAAAVNAGEMEAGRAINKRIAAVFGSKVKLPFGTNGMINTPVGHVVLANMFATLIREYAPDNKLAQRAADGAVKSAAYELLRDFDIPAMLDEVLDGVVLKDVAEKIEL